MFMKDKLNRILPRVSKPARYTGGEYNSVIKDWEKASVRMVFAFPDVYEVGMSHLGGKILYGLVNEHPDFLMERTFAPWVDMEEQMRAEGLPLFSLETWRPVREFDVVGFSLQYELSITNVLNMLDLAGIPLWHRERKEEHPLVIAGGPVCFNPEPVSPFFDAFLIGDGEELLPEFLEVIRDNRGRAREDLLRKLAGLEGVYVPRFYEPEYYADGTFKRMRPADPSLPARIRKRLVTDLDRTYYPRQPVVPYLDIVHDRAVLEVMRGCQRACRFCQAGIIYRPVREKSLPLLLEQAGALLKNTGYEDLSLASLSTADYSNIEKLVTSLVDRYGPRGIGVSLPSLRADAFSVRLAAEVQKVRKTTLTFAPEAGTQRLRNVINKNVSEQDLLDAVEAAFSAGWLGVKLYFMLGLPTETYADLDGIV
ncbi:MAG: TIGR03960 family B12-binding radical SAM protein, partial [Syntrophomonadaceae bacterium]|nr:TIGR03960 family B12-binding radical SAM protein [Syntrophomonadaceae bacterium]